MTEYPTVGWNQQKLHEALKSSDLLTRIGAIRAIQETPGEEYVQALCDALGDRDRLVRVNAAIALGKAKSPQAVIPLIRHAVSDPDADVQSYALWAYRQIDYQKASPQLVELLVSGDDIAMARFAANEVRQKTDMKAIEAIVQRFHSRQLYAWNDLDTRAVNALYEIGNVTVEPLVKSLDNPDARVQVNAIYALGRIGDDRAVIPLIAHIAPANVDIRARISDALVKIGRPAIADLIKLLDNNDRDIRWIAAYTLGSIGEDAEPALLKALQARDEKPAEDIIYALGSAGGRNSFSPLYAIFGSTKDDSVRAWSTISLASLTSRCYEDLDEDKTADRFLDALGEQLKPHMLLNSETLLRLGRIYITRSLSVPPEQFPANVTTAVKCFDLSLIEQDNAVARAYRLFFGSYMKLMTSKSPEIMNYVERDFADLKKDAEKAEHKKEIMLLSSEVLGVLRNAYNDRNFDFAGRFDSYVELCLSVERFLPAVTPKEDARKLSQKEIAKLHTDVEIIQRKVSLLIERLGAAGDEDSAAQALRLSTELAKVDTGVYTDYRIAESCLKNIVAKQKLSDDGKSDLLYKVLMIGKNGLPQIDLTVDQLLKGLKVEAKPAEKSEPAAEKTVLPKEKKKSHLVEYIIIAVLVIMIVAVIVIVANKLGYITLPFTFPISWLNKA